jgi:hypothetical protein
MTLLFYLSNLEAELKLAETEKPLEKHIRMSLPNDICPNDIANDIAA